MDPETNGGVNDGGDAQAGGAGDQAVSAGAGAPQEGGQPESMDAAIAAALRGPAGEAGADGDGGGNAGTEDGGVAPADASAAADDSARGAPKAKAQGQDGQPQGKRKHDPDFVPPAGLAPEAAQRFTKLVDRVRSAEGKAAKYDEFKPRYDQMEADVNELRQLMSDHQCAPEDLGAFLEFNRLRKTGDLAGARNMALQLLQEMSLELGEAIDPIDPLAKFPDLLQEVEDGYVTRQRAIELARARSREEGERRQQQQQESAQRGQSEMQRAVETATSQISAWAKQLRDSDIDFVGKEKALLERIDEVVALYGDYPHLWLPTLQREYKLLKSGAAAPGEGAPAGGGSSNRPLRPIGAGSSMRQAPKNEFEAIKLAVTGGLVG